MNTLKYPKYWTHWIIQVCPNENCSFRAQSQSPVCDFFGEDCNLFEKIKEWNQWLIDNPCKCGCGKNEIITYRHAKFDHPEVENFWKEKDV